MKKYLKLLRVEHYIKNFIVFLPLVFSINLLNWELCSKTIIGFIVFCLCSSVVYIINDLKDIEKDKLHSTKCKRPLASGAIKKPVAYATIVVLILTSAVLLYFLNSWIASLIAVIYIAVNIAYSCGLKNIPILDVALLSLGYILRVIFGAVVINVPISEWLLFVVLTASLYMGLGKRKNELISEKEETRAVNDLYTVEFLDKNMYVCVTLTIAFYALWCITSPTVTSFANNGIIYSLPIVLLVFLKYSYTLENTKKISSGDPISVFLKDWILIALAALYVIYCFIIIYVPIGL